MTNDLGEFIRLMERIERVMRILPARAAAVAVNFSKDRFRQQAWVDTNTEPWAKRKSSGWGKRERRGRAILVDSGRLRRSIRVVTVAETYAVIGSHEPYAKVHNDGFRGKITQKVRAHSYSRYGKQKQGTGVYSIKTKRESTKTVRVKGGDIQVKAFTRTVNQRIPRRRFIGPSAIMDRQLQRMMTAEIQRAIVG
ncbi:phage virion morphogenesis protein [Williamwhitmania taraxaci]|uniref:Phage virion morphogenesis family protein n=1 Tax=Williamwhitmania taraxaci TaxID=1640674 RepID=A0A1G6MC06_9BACT|nr:phage virion morphogenesis protein [Williamwhitmania taraxaci]SDC53138.1 Phage virion morphogenesis family protein [Williamwhitmania taraxaci]